jgi:hypothetical protein
MKIMINKHFAEKNKMKLGTKEVVDIMFSSSLDDFSASEAKCSSRRKMFGPNIV